MSLDRTRPPRPGAAPHLAIPRADRTRLENGMGLAWVRRAELPEATLSLVVPAGADTTGAEEAGLASLVAKVLPEGAAGRSSRQMAAWLDGLGIHFGVAVGYDSMILRLHTLSEHLEPALEALAAIALEPEFREGEFERCRGERLDAIRRMRDEAAEVAADVLAELLYGHHPYGRVTRGREGTVQELERSDLAAFHRRRFSPRGSTLVVCGDLPDDFEDLVARRFGHWGGADVNDGPPASERQATSPGIVLVNRPGAGQSEIRIGAMGLRRGDPDEFTARMMNSILGGLFNSRLNLNLREDKGWTYGAKSSLALRRSRGPLTLRAAVETAVTADAVREMLCEVGRMRDEPPTDSEMLTALGALTRSLPLRFETNRQIKSTLVEQVVYDLWDDYWATFSARIEEVDRHQVQELAARLLEPSDLVVLVVGDAEVVLPDLEALGSVAMREAP